MTLASSTNTDLNTLISLSKEIFMGCARQKRYRQLCCRHTYIAKSRNILWKRCVAKNAVQMIVLKSLTFLWETLPLLYTHIFGQRRFILIYSHVKHVGNDQIERMAQKQRQNFNFMCPWKRKVVHNNLHAVIANFLVLQSNRKCSGNQNRCWIAWWFLPSDGNLQFTIYNTTKLATTGAHTNFSCV